MSEAKPADEVFDQLGWNLGLAQERDQMLIQMNKRDTRICICGHAMRRHDIVGGRTDLMSCNPNRYHCACKYNNMRAVIAVEDIRVFNRKTEGIGTDHALFRGMQACTGDPNASSKSPRRAQKITILEPFACAVCGTTEGSILPVAWDPRTGAVSPLVYHGHDQFRCQACMGAKYGN